MDAMYGYSSDEDEQGHDMIESAEGGGEEQDKAEDEMEEDSDQSQGKLQAMFYDKIKIRFVKFSNLMYEYHVFNRFQEYIDFIL